MSVKNIEKEENDPRLSTIQAVKTALEAAGIEFIQDGVRLRENP